MLSGEVVAGPHVRAAAKRHMDDLAHGHERGIHFDEEQATHVINYFPTILRLNGGQFEGNPFVLHESQEFIIGSLFGWKRADNTRRYRLAYIEEGKGNGKSPLLAGIGLFCMASDFEPRAEVYSAATKKDQAMILFRDAVAMVDQSVPLTRAIKKSGQDEKVWSLYHEKSKSFFRPISADDGQSGPRPHVGLIDELHEHKSPKVINIMAAGRKWRRQPLIVAITNSGTDRHSVCWEYREKGIRVCTGMEIDDTYFAYICALDEGDDPFASEDCWPKANPLIDVVVSRQYLRDEVNNARGMSSKESTVRRLNFCQWMEAESPFIPYDKWKAAEASFELEDFSGMECIAAFDLSATRDLTACVMLFEKEGLKWAWPLFWIPKEGLDERVRRDCVPFDIWVRKGYVLTTPGEAIDKDFVVAQVNALVGKHDITIKKAPYDRHRIDVLQAALQRAGAEWPLEPFGQGTVSMSPALDEIETALTNFTFRHPGNPCFDWNAANAVTFENAVGEKKFDKSKATGRIDGMVALAMAMGAGIKSGLVGEPKYQMFVLGGKNRADTYLK